MDLNASVPASAPSSASANTSQTGQTGKQETVAAAAAAESKEENMTPKDTVEISDAAEAASEKAKSEEGHWKDFDMDAFQQGIRNQLLESINESRNALKDAGVELYESEGDSVLYNLGDKDVKAAEVPEYWNAENTSQRIVDFAMSFRELAPELTDEEYINQVRDAVELGYKLAKQDVGAMPGPSAQLFNDTYNLTMEKFDKYMEEAQNRTSEVAKGTAQ